MTSRQVFLAPGIYPGVQRLEYCDKNENIVIFCWCRKGIFCNTACAAFQLDSNEVYCLALPVLGAQRIAQFVPAKKTLLDAHADAVEAAERDEEEEDRAANEAKEE